MEGRDAWVRVTVAISPLLGRGPELNNSAIEMGGVDIGWFCSVLGCFVVVDSSSYSSRPLLGWRSDEVQSLVTTKYQYQPSQMPTTIPVDERDQTQ